MPINDPTALLPPLGQGVLYVQALAPKAGKAVGVTSGIRTNDEQIALRRSHCGPTHYDIYEKPSGQCSPPTARPGTSKHQTGGAVDLNGDLDWAFAQLSPFGFTRPVGGEAWHFEHPLARPIETPEDAIKVAKVIGKMARSLQDKLGVGEEEAYNLMGVKPGQTTFDVGPISLPNPGVVGGAIIDGVGDLVPDPLAGLGRLLGYLLDPEFWKRLGLGAAGLALVILGALTIARDSVAGAITDTIGGASA